MSGVVTESLAHRCGFLLCVECGKCSAVCPMASLFADYRYDVSPRGIIDRALLGGDFEHDDDLWACLTCNLCTDLCPAGVRVRDYVVAARDMILAAGRTEHADFCRGCGTYLGPRHTTDHLERSFGPQGAELLTLCAACRRRDLAAKVRGLVPGRPVLAAQRGETAVRVSLDLHLPVLPEAIGRKHLEVEYAGKTVGDLLDHLVRRYGRAAREALYGEDGALDPVIQVVVNGKAWVTREHLDTVLVEGDAVVIMALLAGG